MVSIIIVNYNTTKLLINTIESIYSKTKDVNFEIIIVDNNSSDNCYQLLFDRFGNNLQYILLPENIGFGRANNIGIELAISHSKYIFLLNPDTLLVNNAIKILVDFLEKNDGVGVVGGNLYDINMKPIYSYHRLLPGILIDEMRYWTLGLNKLFIHQPFYNLTQYPLNVGNISGADMLIRSEALQKVGFFDSDFFMYNEETELTFRIRRAGYKVMNVPSAKIIHLEGQSFQFNSVRIRRMLEGRELYYKKTRGLFYLWWANLLLVGGLVFRIFIHSIINRKQRQYFIDYLNIVINVYYK